MDQPPDPRKDRPAHGWRGAPRPRGLVEHATSALQPTPELLRFSALFDAFRDLAREREDVQVRGSAFPPLGFAVRLQPRPTSAGGELSLWPAAGRFLTWSRAGDPALERNGAQSLHIDLSSSFRWEMLVFTDAEHLAGTLLRWMEDRITAEDAAGERDEP